MNQAILILLVSGVAMADIGGYMSQCYDGTFQTDKICEEKSASVEKAHDNNPINVSVSAKASYLDKKGEKVRVELSLRLEDSNNFFDPEGHLPVLVRVIKKSMHRLPPQYSVKSIPVVLMHEEGKRVWGLVSGTLSIDLFNNWGAEYVELIEKVEVLVPGVAGVYMLPL